MKKVFFNPGTHSTPTSLGLAILRLAPALMLAITHGWGKLRGFSENADGFLDPLGIGNQLSMACTIGAEFFCATAVALGLATRWTAAPVVFTMGVAAFMVHADDPWGKKELALLYAIPFLTLIFTGAGKISLDGLIYKGKS